MTSITSKNYKWLVLTITCVALFMAPLDATIVNVSLPSMASSLRLNYANLIWVPTAYLLTFTVLPLTMGRLSDMRGRKPVFIFGVLLFSLASFLCSTAINGAELVAFRALQGAGAGSIAAVCAAIVADVFPRNERGKALGINAMTIYIGLTAGPSVGGFLTYAVGWRSIFYVNVPIGLSVAVLASLKMKESSSKGSGQSARLSQRFDLAGVLTFSLGLASLLVALTLAAVYGWTSLGIVATFAVAFLALSVFLLVEVRRSANRREALKEQSAKTGDGSQDELGAPGKGSGSGQRQVEPMLDVSLFTQNRLFAAGNISALLNYLSYYCVSFLSAFYLQRVVGYNSLQAGIVLLAMPATMAVLSPVSGWFSDRVGSRALASLGMALITAGLLLMSTLNPVSVSSSPPAAVTATTEEVALYLFIIGFGMGMFSAPNTSAVIGSVDPSRTGVASGTLSTMRYMGQSLSLAMMGAILASVASNAVVSAFFVGTSTSTVTGATIRLFLSGMKEALLVGAMIAAVGALTSLVRGPKRPESVNT